MGKFPNVHCFRLSDADEEKYRALLERFHLEIYREQSRTFRALLKNLTHFFRDVDDGAPTDPEAKEIQDQVHSWAPLDEDQLESDRISAAQYAELKERGRIGRKIFSLSVSELHVEGKPISPENVDLKSREVRKRLGVDETNQPIERRDG